MHQGSDPGERSSERMGNEDCAGERDARGFGCPRIVADGAEIAAYDEEPERQRDEDGYSDPDDYGVREPMDIAACKNPKPTRRRSRRAPRAQVLHNTDENGRDAERRDDC
ncbi:hypothetical protein D3C80_1740130 [compost metagenome]